MIITAGKDVLPEIVPSSVCRDLVELRDVMPTLLDIAGAEIPDTVDGHSLLPLVSDPERSLRNWLHGEHAFSEFSNHWIVTRYDKYIWHSSSGKEQYFNLKDDPHELNDLINDPLCQKRIDELRKHLINSLTGRPEGYTDGNKLIPGRTAVDVLPGFYSE